MNIAKILELQDLYIEAGKINKEFEDSEINKKYIKAKDSRSAAKNAIQDILKQADDYQVALGALSKQIDNLADEAKEISDSDYDGIEMDELNDEKVSIDNCKKEIQGLVSKIDGTKQALQALFRKISMVVNEYKKYDTERNALKPKFEEASVQTKQKLDEINAKVKALNEDMEEFIIEGEGLLARALLHEIDHLNGVLYVDKVEGELLDTAALSEEKEQWS